MWQQIYVTARDDRASYVHDSSTRVSTSCGALSFLLAVGIVTLFLDNDSLAEITKKKRVDAKWPITQAYGTREGNKARRRTLPRCCICVSKSTGA